MTALPWGRGWKDGWVSNHKYTEEFKRDAVALVAKGMTRKQVCADLGISKTALATWMLQDEAQSRGFEVPTSADEVSQLRGALRRIRELEMENEVLRKAAAYLSQASISPK